MPIAIPCLCFALAKLETEWKLSVTAGSTNTAVTDRTIRLYRPRRARAGGVGRATHPSRNVLIKWHIVFLNPRHQNQMSLITLDRTKKPLWRSHKHGVTLFCSMNALKGSSLFYPSLCKKSKLPSSSSASSQYRAEVHPALNNEIHLGCGGLDTWHSPHRGFQELFYINSFNPQTPSPSQVSLSSPASYNLWKKSPSPCSFSYPCLHDPQWKRREGEKRTGR